MRPFANGVAVSCSAKCNRKQASQNEQCGVVGKPYAVDKQRLVINDQLWKGNETCNALCMKKKEKGLAVLGTAVFAVLAALVGTFIRKL